MIELKARVSDHNIFRKKLAVIGAKYVETLHQKDVYFKVPKGRLKLRELKGSSIAELIYYERQNIVGPKNDKVFIIKFEEPKELKAILGKILNPLIIVEKNREIYHYYESRMSSENMCVRVHLDEVTNLGTFVELELESSEETRETDRLFLKNVAGKLGLIEKKLEKLSYSDLLVNKKNGN